MKRILAFVLILIMLMSTACSKPEDNEVASSIDENVQAENTDNKVDPENQPQNDNDNDETAKEDQSEQNQDKAPITDNNQQQENDNSDSTATNEQKENVDKNESDTNEQQNKPETTAPEQQPEDEKSEPVHDDSNATPASSFEYKINYEENKVYIHGYTGSEKDVVIPNYIEGYPVSYISKFRTSTVETLVIPENVTGIAPNAIIDENLKTVTIKSKTVTVWSQAFEGCSTLESVTFLGDVTVEGVSFNRCDNLKEVIFHGNAPETIFSKTHLISVWYWDKVIIKYKKGTTGWDDPKWEGYNLVEIK